MIYNIGAYRVGHVLTEYINKIMNVPMVKNVSLDAKNLIRLKIFKRIAR